MVQLIKELNGVECHFYKDTDFPHIDYTSVSTVKKKYVRPLDPNQAEISSKNPQSKWYQMSVEDIKLAWDLKAETGRNYGTWVHDVIERYLKNEESYKLMTPEEKKVCDAFQNYISNYYMRENIVHSEYCVSMDICDESRTLFTHHIDAMDREELIELLDACRNCSYGKAYFEEMETDLIRELAKKYLIKFGLAGTIDQLIIYPNRFMIGDIKVDEWISVKGYPFSENAMLEPLSHLETCNYETYSLQIWMYAIMVEKKLGLPFTGGKIFHWRKDKERFTLLNIANRKAEAREILQHFFKIGKYKAA